MQEEIKDKTKRPRLPKKKWIFLSLILLFVVLYFIFNIFRTPGNEEKTCLNCPVKLATAGEEAFEDDIQVAAVATMFGSKTEYFNWVPKDPCPGLEGCYLKEIKASVVFLNVGEASITSEKGAAFVQIASNRESNCQDASKASFGRYLAYSPEIIGGEFYSGHTCAETADLNTCNLLKGDGFKEESNCFSLKLFSPSQNEGEINFTTNILSISYVWAWDDALNPMNNDETQ